MEDNKDIIDYKRQGLIGLESKKPRPNVLSNIILTVVTLARLTELLNLEYLIPDLWGWLTHIHKKLGQRDWVTLSLLAVLIVA